MVVTYWVRAKSFLINLFWCCAGRHAGDVPVQPGACAPGACRQARHGRATHSLRLSGIYPEDSPAPAGPCVVRFLGVFGGALGMPRMGHTTLLVGFGGGEHAAQTACNLATFKC